MFDATLLPDADFQFVVVSDTHYMLDSGTRPVEFESRRRQTARAERALRLIASLDSAFVVHLGDLAQDVPGTDRFEEAMAAALEQLERCGVRPRHVAGNQDIGDKPDPTMPTPWVTRESLAAFQALLGPSWYSWDWEEVHCAVLNAPIMNSALPEAQEQRRWLESDLLAHAGKRIFLFLHLPLYLHDSSEPDLGHYDNLGEPARAWLLDLARKHEVELIFAGHSHFAFFDRLGGTRYFVVPSTAFTRPGFSELFSSGPPPEQGRDDAAKLGFYLARVHDDGVRVHSIRTQGSISPVEGGSGLRQLITRTSPDLPHSPLGLILRHPLARTAEVPSAWPSTIRQRVRNDYPLLACLELGVRHVRVPASDLADPLQSRRLEILRQEGMSITAAWQWYDRLDLARAAAGQRSQVDSVELQHLGSPWPAEACLDQIHRCRAELGIPLTLSTLIPREQVPGKQLARTRSGFLPDELTELNRRLLERGVKLDRVLCRVPANASPWDSMQPGLEMASLTQIGAIDWAVELATTVEESQIERVAEALFAAAPGTEGGRGHRSRLFLEPLVDIDRCMDVAHGLLDRLCNPRPAFHVVRCLNTILFGAPAVRRPVRVPALAGARILALEGATDIVWLLLPLSHGQKALSLAPLDLSGLSAGVIRACIYHLETGMSQTLPVTDGQVLLDGLSSDEATLLIFERRCSQEA